MTLPVSSERAPLAFDALPLDAIGLSRVFRIVANALESRPDIAISLDPVLYGLLEYDVERKIGISLSDYARLTPEPFIEDMKANVFLRDRLSREELLALVRDPDTGETLKLPPTSWMPIQWLETGHIEPGIFTDHVHIDEPHSPGPSGTLIRGKIRPVFFRQAEFETWYLSVFGSSLVIADSVSVATATPDPETSSTAHRRTAIKQALDALYGAGGPPAGLSAIARDRAINEWLLMNGRSRVSEATIRRALKDLRVASSDRS